MPAFVVGIGGGSASGKSTIAEKLRKHLAPLRVQVINQDHYFKEAAHLPRHANRRGSRVWPDHNHPDSIDFPRLREALRAARNGDTDVVIVEGILTLCDPELRGLMDLKLFVAADPDERTVRRIRRNVAVGYSLDDICDFYLDSVRYRHQEFCQPTRTHADLVIPGGQDEADAAGRALDEACCRVWGAVREAGGGLPQPADSG